MKGVVVLGGTTEGRQIVENALALDVPVTVCVASAAGENAMGDVGRLARVLVGRLDASQMQELFAQSADVVVDATHPYATQVTQNARLATDRCGIPYIRVTRPSSDLDGCVVARDLEQAVSLVPNHGNVLATTGGKETSPYLRIAERRTRLFLRVLDKETALGVARDLDAPLEHVLFGRGPFSVEENLRVIDEHEIRHLITKDGGDVGGFPQKVEAARMRDVNVYVIARPHDDGVTTEVAMQLLRGYLAC